MEKEEHIESECEIFYADIVDGDGFINFLNPDSLEVGGILEIYSESQGPTKFAVYSIDKDSGLIEVLRRVVGTAPEKEIPSIEYRRLSYTHKSLHDSELLQLDQEVIPKYLEDDFQINAAYNRFNDKLEILRIKSTEEPW